VGKLPTPHPPVSLQKKNKSVTAVYCISVFSATKVQSKSELYSLSVKGKGKNFPQHILDCSSLWFEPFLNISYLLCRCIEETMSFHNT